MSELGGSTANGAAGAVSSGLAVGGVSGPAAGGGATTPETTGGLSWGQLLTGATGTGADADLGALAGTLPNGGASLLGHLTAGALPVHPHQDADSGGVIDYARLVVASTAPPAPEAPSDAFWLNPTEVA